MADECYFFIDAALVASQGSLVYHLYFWTSLSLAYNNDLYQTVFNRWTP